MIESGDRPTRFAYLQALKGRLKEQRFVPPDLAKSLNALTQSLLPYSRRRQIEEAQAISGMAEEAQRVAWSLRRGDATSPGKAIMNERYKDVLDRVATDDPIYEVPIMPGTPGARRAKSGGRLAAS